MEGLVQFVSQDHADLCTRARTQLTAREISSSEPELLRVSEGGLSLSLTDHKMHLSLDYLMLAEVLKLKRQQMMFLLSLLLQSTICYYRYTRPQTG